MGSQQVEPGTTSPGRNPAGFQRKACIGECWHYGYFFYFILFSFYFSFLSGDECSHPWWCSIFWTGCGVWDISSECSATVHHPWHHSYCREQPGKVTGLLMIILQCWLEKFLSVKKTSTLPLKHSTRGLRNLLKGAGRQKFLVKYSWSRKNFVLRKKSGKRYYAIFFRLRKKWNWE